MGQFGIGQPVPRTEDPRLLKGAGRYIDDVASPDCLHGYVVRSPFANARFEIGDVEPAKAAPGVHAVLTGADFAASGLGVPTPLVPRTRRDASPAFVCPHALLVDGQARYVGDYVAFIVAETLNQAKDAAELLEIEYDPLPATILVRDAVADGAPLVWPDGTGNEAFTHDQGDRQAVDAAFADAAHVVAQDFTINRLAANPMETRRCLADYDAAADRYTIYCSVQAPHLTRTQLANQIFHEPHAKFRVICENMGGAFGMKGTLYNEYALCLWAAKRIGRPVKWVAERGESLLSDDHARDNFTAGELALDANGQFLALRVRTLANVGAYYTSDRSALAPTVNLGVLAGTYTTPAIHVEVTAVLTNTRMTGPYRGAGRPEAAYVIESLIDKAARTLGHDPAALRRQNTIPASAMPFQSGLVYNYDSGDFAKNLEDGLKLGDYDGFAARRTETEARGKLRGIGISNTVERAGGVGLETAEVRFDPAGGVTLVMGTSDHGQGHETIFKQILSHELGIDTDTIRFVDGDTDLVAMGTGTFGSRSATLGGTALHLASQKIIAKGKRIAGHMMEAGLEDIAFDNGTFTVAGTDKSVSITDVAKLAFLPAKLPRDIEPGLYETGTYEPEVPNFPNGTHLCEVEIDPATGVTEIVRYSVVDDVGTVINPLLLKGQIHGGIVQGAGQALMEDAAYDPESGQLIAGSFMDYAMPRADNFCDFEVSSNSYPTATNPLGVKGAGEAGTVGALPTVMSAINDALHGIGADYVEMPATAEKVWRSIRAVRTNAAA